MGVAGDAGARGKGPSSGLDASSTGADSGGGGAVSSMLSRSTSACAGLVSERHTKVKFKNKNKQAAHLNGLGRTRAALFTLHT
jgi:hypothetical protein